jgi:hypothetical protein
MRTVAEIKNAVRGLANADRDEIRHWLDVHQDTQEIIELVVRLTQSYTIWWMLMEKQNAEKYEEVKREYLDFFEPLTHLLLWEGFFVIYAQIFAHDFGGHRSKHIQSLIMELRLKDDALACALETKIKTNPFLGKAKTIRNKISAHREAGLTPGRLLDLVKPVRKDLDGAVIFAQEIVCEVAEALGVEKAGDVKQRISSCEGSTRDHTFQVLEVLNRDLKRNNSTDE